MTEVPLVSARESGSGDVARSVWEVLRSGAVPRWVHPEWEALFPWLAQGTTGRGEDGRAADFALFGGDGKRSLDTPWVRLAEAEGFDVVAHARQVHGPRVLTYDASALLSGSIAPDLLGRSEDVGDASGPFRLVIGPDADGHASAAPGLLVGITVADCVPVFVVDPEQRITGLLHAGWRGAASGILEGGLKTLRSRFGSLARDLHVHLGPAICGRCYEVGREVHLALGLPDPEGPQPVDLRMILADRALRLGVRRDRITRSAFCTRCGGSPFFSHRRGDAARQVAFLGIKAIATTGAA